MNHTEKIKSLTTAAQDAIAKAKAAATDAERQRHLAEAKSATEEIKRIRHDLAIAAEAKSIADEIGDPAGTPGGGTERVGVTTATKAGRRAVAKAAADRLHGVQPDGRKAATLAPSGAALVGVPGPNEIAAQGRPTRLLEALPYLPVSAPVWRLARQTVRTNKAAIVAPGDTKPESDFGVEVLENRLEVFAHILSGVDQYVLSDSSALQKFLADEMIAGVLDAVEREVVAGDGTDDHLEGLLNVNGSVARAFEDDPLTTLRLALAEGEVAGVRHDLIVLNPLDHARIELQRAPGSGQFDLDTAPVDRAERRIWGVPVVTAAGVTQGTAIVLDRSAVAVRSDDVMSVRYSDAAGFSENTVTIRAEQRFGLDIYRPAAITVATIAGTP